MIGFILAAGFGTRLKPITDTVPKALVPVCGEPLLAHNLRTLHKSGVFSAIGVNSHYLHEQMERFQKRSTVPFTLFHEADKIRGTGGALDFARSFLSGDEAFLIANVDILHKFDIAELSARFMRSGRICSLVAVPVVEGRGTIIYDGVIGDYLGVPVKDGEKEKSQNQSQNLFMGTGDTPVTPLLKPIYPKTHILKQDTGGNFTTADFTGVAFYRREFLDYVTADDFSIIPIWQRAADAGNVPGILIPDPSASWWMDIGTHEALAEIEKEWN